MSILRSMILGTVLWAGAASVFPVGARAEAQHGQCKQEINQLCAGVVGGPAFQECVTKNLDRLSPECKERVRIRRARHKQKTPTSEGAPTSEGGATQ